MSPHHVCKSVTCTPTMFAGVDVEPKNLTTQHRYWLFVNPPNVRQGFSKGLCDNQAPFRSRFRQSPQAAWVLWAWTLFTAGLCGIRAPFRSRFRQSPQGAWVLWAWTPEAPSRDGSHRVRCPARSAPTPALKDFFWTDLQKHFLALFEALKHELKMLRYWVCLTPRKVMRGTCHQVSYTCFSTLNIRSGRNTHDQPSLIINKMLRCWVCLTPREVIHGTCH